jgi:hypothetical protein
MKLKIFSLVMAGVGCRYTLARPATFMSVGAYLGAGGPLAFAGQPAANSERRYSLAKA